MENTKKNVTKAQVLMAVKALAETMGADEAFEIGEVEVTAQDIVDYVDTTVAQIAAKNEKAKERAAEKRAEGDALRERVLATLTSEFQTRDEIVAALDDAEITPAKVTARLTQLVTAGAVEKDVVKVEKSKKTVYRIAQ